MRSIAGALVLLTALGCPKRDNAEASSSADPPPEAGAPAFDRRAERAVLINRLRSAGIADERVLSAMQRVERHAFVPETEQRRAYANEALQIGHGQTISQPMVVAAMTEAARPGPGDKCLEVGTGSGYQAAVLAELCDKVYSIEYLEPLAQWAERNLRQAGYDASRVMLRAGDGYHGWPDEAPFDVVLVTAAPDKVPKPLLDQMAPGGRLVIPVGPRHAAQQLELWTRSRDVDGGFTRATLMVVRFVPFLGDAGSPRP
ncbi:MAG TPA: protein-L-isoaspartate(D-aspartate) O-methyltransferase [Polyangiaceae bacterium]|nr:protein-L-isoaspartate(D-aspartate) O-methyltransferase [Polyangiaceae bacterium]